MKSLQVALIASVDSSITPSDNYLSSWLLASKRTASRVLSGSLILFALLVGSPAAAQTSLTGFPPFVPQAGGPWDSVNLANLNVHLHIPITARKGRGPAFNYAVNYDNSIFSLYLGFHWVVNTGWDAAFGTVPPGLPVGSVHVSASQQITCSNGSVGTQNTFDGYSDAFRTFHPFAANIVTNPCNGSGGTSTTNDGSGYKVTINGPNDPGTAVSRDGTMFFYGGGTPSSPQTITDSNGNQPSFDGTTITDTLGTTPLTSSSTSNSFSYSFPNFQTGTSTITFSLMNPAPTIQTAFQCNGTVDAGPSSGAPVSVVLLVDTITLQDGVSMYKFTYEPTPGNPSNTTGRLASVKLPTGATISYSYPGPNDGTNCLDGTAMNLTRITSDGTWTYSRTVAADGRTTVSTTITDPQNNQTVVYFSSGWKPRGRSIRARAPPARSCRQSIPATTAASRTVTTPQ